MQWDPRPALGVVLAAAGYPDSVRKGDVIEGLDAAARLPGKIFHAGTRLEGDARAHQRRARAVRGRPGRRRRGGAARRPTRSRGRCALRACSSGTTSATARSSANWPGSARDSLGLPGAVRHRARRARSRHRRLRPCQQFRLSHLARPLRLVAFRRARHAAGANAPACGAAWPRSASRSTTCAPRSRTMSSQVGTWIVHSDGRLRCSRRFQLWRARDRQTLARASVEYVCINLDSGRAVRMPESFTRAYVITAHRPAGAPDVWSNQRRGADQKLKRRNAWGPLMLMFRYPRKERAAVVAERAARLGVTGADDEVRIPAVLDVGMLIGVPALGAADRRLQKGPVRGRRPAAREAPDQDRRAAPGRATPRRLPRAARS